MGGLTRVFVFSFAIAWEDWQFKALRVIFTLYAIAKIPL